MNTWLVLAILIVSGVGQAPGGQERQTLPPELASQRVGHAATFCGRALALGCDSPDPGAALTFSTRWGLPALSVVIAPTVGVAVGGRDRYEAARVCVTGTVETAPGGYHISVTNGDQLRIDRSTQSASAGGDADVYRSCDAGVIPPKVLKETRPRYTAEAMGSGIQGSVTVQGVVRTDGSVGDVEVVRSLDPNGLDASVVEAVEQWRFEPGRRQGRAVPVIISIQLAFTLG